MSQGNIPEGLNDRYDAAIRAQANHIRIAGALIKHALDILNGDNGSKLDVEDLTKATAALEKGTRMETRANAEMIKLTKEKPR